MYKCFVVFVVFLFLFFLYFFFSGKKVLYCYETGVIKINGEKQDIFSNT